MTVADQEQSEPNTTGRGKYSKVIRGLHDAIGTIQRLANEALAEKDAEIAQLRAALEPFALIGLDVLKSHPGWANAGFSSEWAGYRITYPQFEAAAAAVIAVELQKQKSPPRASGEG